MMSTESINLRVIETGHRIRVPLRWPQHPGSFPGIVAKEFFRISWRIRGRFELCEVIGSHPVRRPDR